MYKFAKKLLADAAKEYEVGERIFDAMANKLERLERAKKLPKPYQHLKMITDATEKLMGARVAMLEAEVGAAAAKVSHQATQIRLQELQIARFRRLLRVRRRVR